MMESTNIHQSVYRSGNVMKTLKPLLLYECSNTYHLEMVPEDYSAYDSISSPDATRVIFFQNTDLSMLPLTS